VRARLQRLEGERTAFIGRGRAEADETAPA
jgi:hypothetical protein